VTDTVIENTGSILTRFTDNAYASIVYSTREGQFESKWSIRRKRTGKLESPHMEICNLKEGKVLDLKKSEVPKENERLIGLNYDQFVKSIILSQGEERNKADFSKYKSEQSKVMAEMSALLQSEVSTDDFMSKMKDLEAKVTKMDASLHSLKEQGVKLGVNIKKAAGAKSFASAKDISNQSKGVAYDEVVQNHKQRLSTQLKTLKLEPGTSTDAIREELEKSQAIFASMKDQLLKTEQLEKLKNLEQEISKNNQADAKTLKELEPKLVKCQKQIIDLKDSLKSIRIEKEKSAALFDLNDYRSALKSGEACPLCGSLEHPLAAHQEAKPSGFDAEIAKTEKAIKIEEQNLNDFNKKQTALQTGIANYENQLKDIQMQLNSLSAWFKKEKISVIPLGQVKQDYEALEAKLQNINQGQLCLEEYQWLLEIEQEVAELLKIGSLYSEQIKARKRVFEGDNLADITNKLQNQFTELKSKMETSQALLDKTKADSEVELKTMTNLEASLLPKLNKIGFDSLELAQGAMLSEGAIAKFKSEKETHQKNKISLESNQKRIKIDLDKLIKADKPKVDIAALQISIQDSEAARKNLSEKIGAAKNKLQNDSENKKKVGKIQKDLEKQTNELDNWALLSRLIGDKTGAKFANYAQNITLKQLLSLANKRLEKLFDRYFLDMPTNDGELMIRDRYQGDIERGVSTLSGGETFMISLALALSLSDMASKNVALESLFIDEGFSTLDPEMLDLAMSTLDRIQSESQKTVGIISHVESLKNRIEVQIQLQKDTQGYSTIHIEG